MVSTAKTVLFQDILQTSSAATSAEESISLPTFPSNIEATNIPMFASLATTTTLATFSDRIHTTSSNSRIWYLVSISNYNSFYSHSFHQDDIVTTNNRLSVLSIRDYK